MRVPKVGEVWILEDNSGAAYRTVLFVSESRLHHVAFDLETGHYLKQFHYLGKEMPVGWRKFA